MAHAQVTFPRPAAFHSVNLNADEIVHWRQGEFEILHLKGHASVSQGDLDASADQAIIWVEIPQGTNDTQPHKVIVYLQGQAEVILDANGSSRIVDETWLGRLFTSGTVELGRGSTTLKSNPPAIFSSATQALQGAPTGSVSQASLQSPSSETWSSTPEPRVAQQPQMVINPSTGQLQAVPQADPFGVPGRPALTPPNNFTNNAEPNNVGPNLVAPNNIPATVLPQAPATRPRSTIKIDPRDGNITPTLRSRLNPQNPNERITIGSGGVRITIDSDEIANAELFRTDASRQLVISADDIVYWELSLPDGTTRNQIYLEGNIVFAKGKRVIYADRMFYDAETQQGTILKAEVLTTIKNFDGAVRMKADVIQQMDQNNLQAYGAAFTSSRLGVPRYWLQSESIGIQQVPGQSTDALVFDPANSPSTGLQSSSEEDDQYLLDSQRNRVYVAGVPVFAWPRLRTNLNEPTLYLERLGINNDRIFGFQLTSGWNMYQLLGQQPVEGTRWIGLLDYLSDRGVGFGSEFEYDRSSLFGVPGRAKGSYKSWFINEQGLDFLGRDRRDLTPEEDFRGRSVLKHRHDFAPGYQLRAELGYISDRNFLEQYYEREWDTEKDATTGFWLERNSGTDSFNLTGDLQLNEFFTQTSGLKFDWFKLGQPILNNQAIWHSRSHAGYLRLRQAEVPTDPTDAAKFDPLAWEENDVDGFRVGTRQEVDFPMQFGPVKVVPYALGDATYWQEALDGEDLFRVYGQTGIRASLPMWRVDPSVQSLLWNVNGLAHKVTFDVDAYFADASQDLDELALYDPLDDDSQEHFRRRFAFDTFGILPGGNTPLQFDERYFALRSGMQGNVTAPSTEIADDMAAIKFGVRQRWQTKRGLPGREHIIDWITFDAQATLFPNADRDNFGSDFGMFDYDFRWYVGDRLSLVSDGYFDFFSQGLRTASFGANISRPEIGNAYVGFRTIEGPISSNILSAALTYRMSDKWGVKAGGQVDFGETGSIGQTMSMVYIGESFLWQFGFNYDFSRENFGFRFGFEPRFTQRPRLFRPGGQAIPPASSRWLE